MQLPTVQLEVERLMNLISGFGWSKVKEEVEQGKIRIEIVKETPAAEGVGEAATPT